MYQQLHERLSTIIEDGQQGILSSGNIGLEKESLRVSRDGKISQRPHPVSLGFALTNPYITTDYSEALLELITPPQRGVKAALEFLHNLHRFVYARLDCELLWSASMPCVVTGEDSIPIAGYGSSNLGMMKAVYRRGLGYRYGRMMQVIAGVHFNYSLPDLFWPYYRQRLRRNEPLQDFISAQYFALIRNLQRYGWLIYYLFGASPTICKSFLKGQPGELERFDDGTYFLPYATTLRMADIGYNNNQERETGIRACYDDITSYVKSLTHAIETPCPEYEEIGVKVAGEYRQLNANILQIENEYYSTIRPKQPPIENEKPTHALGQRGVQYVELRSLDVSLFEPLGVGDSQLYFLEAFMIFCLLQQSPLIDDAERRAIDGNERDTAYRGRDPQLKLMRDGQSISLRRWGFEVLHEMQAVCEVLDECSGDDRYGASLRQQVSRLEDPLLTPSARMLGEMRFHGEGFFETASRFSTAHRRQLCNDVLSERDTHFFEAAVERSIDRQRQIEASDTMSFDQFLEDYFARPPRS